MTNLSSEIEQIVKKSFAIRSSKDIELIHRTVDSLLSQTDLLYKAYLPGRDLYFVNTSNLFSSLILIILIQTDSSF